MVISAEQKETYYRPNQSDKSNFIKVISVAMGVAITTLSVLGELEIKDGFTMLGIGIHTIQKK